MRKRLSLLFCVLSLCVPASAADSDLAQMAQKDLVTLGYDPGNTDGEVTTQTVIAISKFQAEHDLEVTGEVSPQLVGALRAAIKKQDQPAGGATKVAATPAPKTPEQQAADLQARQQACLQEKYLAAQQKQKKKRGFGRLLSAVARTGQLGGSDLSSDIYRTTSDIYNVNATAADLSAAARDLGLTEDEVEQCRNPS